jgi:2,5-furandicarboxylate decarboxylase 1
MSRDLRTWIGELQSASLLHEIRKPVDRCTQMGALIYESDKSLLFHNVVGFPEWRVYSQGAVTRPEIDLAAGAPPGGAVQHYAKRLQQPLTPCPIVERGPVQDQVFRGEAADLGKVPVHLVWEGDGGLFIGGGLCIVRDPDTGIRNMAFHRLQVKGPRRTGILARPETHLWQIYEKYEARGEPMPIAIFNGHHPLLYYAAAWSGAFEVDELELAGTLLGEPVELVRCVDVDLEAPALAELVIEGVVPPGVREDEGPFGEFMGYSQSARGMNPVVEVSAITMRRDPIYQAVMNNIQHHSGLNRAAIAFNELRLVGGGIDLRGVHISNDMFSMFVQMVPRYRGQAKNVLMAALSGTYTNTKIAIAVDEDVDIYNPTDVLWAVSTRVNPSRDVFIVDGVQGNSMDMSLDLVGPPGTPQWQTVGSKMGIDATKPPRAIDPKQHADFQRIRPAGFGSVHLRDFLD